MSEQEFVKLTFVNRIAQAEELIQVLKENGIEAYRKGTAMDVYQGTAAQGGDIMVPKTAVARAKEVLEQTVLVETDTSFGTYPQAKSHRILSWILLAAVVILVVLGIAVVFFP